MPILYITTRIKINVKRENYPECMDLQAILEEEASQAEELMIDTLANNGFDEMVVSVEEHNVVLTKSIKNEDKD